MKNIRGVLRVTNTVLSVILCVYMLGELLLGFLFREVVPPIALWAVLLALSVMLWLLLSRKPQENRGIALGKTMLAALLGLMAVHTVISMTKHDHQSLLQCAFCGRDVLACYLLPVAVAAMVLCGFTVRKGYSEIERKSTAVQMLILVVFVCHLLICLVGSALEGSWSGYINKTAIVFYYFPAAVLIRFVVGFIHRTHKPE